jgi:putative protease
LKVAVDYGADAVYIGGKNYGLRAKAGNFTIEEMHEAADYVHAHGAKLYVTVNIFAHNEDIDGIKAYFHELKETGLEEKIDAFIISDPGIFTLAKEILPGIEIHVSTQANNTNYLIYDFWRKQGATRVVAARELSLKEIKTIREHIPADMEIEAFMHGAMCISYSGRCLLSSYFTGRDLRTVLSTQQQVLRLLQGDFLTQTRLVTQAVRVYLHQVMLSTVQEP